MIVRFTCPSGHRIKAESHLQGQEVACPACGGRTRVPAAEQTPITESGAFRFLNDMGPESPHKADPRPVPVIVTAPRTSGPQCPRCKAPHPPTAEVCPACRVLLFPAPDVWKSVCRDAVRSLRVR